MKCVVTAACIIMACWTSAAFGQVCDFGLSSEGCTPPVSRPAAGSSGLATHANLLTVRKPNGGALIKDALYVVRLSCKNIKYKSDNDTWGLFVDKNRVTSHIIALTKQRLADVKLPTDALAAVTVFSITDGAQTKNSFINEGCNVSFVMAGRDPIYLAATANQSETNRPGILTDTVFDLVKIFLSVGPLFHGTTFESHWQAELTAAKDQQPTATNLLTHLDRGNTVTKADDLYEGTTTVTTPYSKVEINISRIKSLVDLNNNRFMSDFETMVKSSKSDLKLDTLSGQSLRTKCEGVGAELFDKNLSANDVSYALAYLANLAPLNKAQTLDCLGPNFALPALKHTSLWTKFHPGKGAPYTEQEVRIKFLNEDVPKPAQPDFALIKDNPMQRLQNALGAYLRLPADKQTDKEKAKVTRLFAPSVHVEDWSGELEIEDGPMSAAAFATVLAKVSRNVGCVTSDTEAGAVFFAFKKPTGQNGKYRPSDALSIRVWVGEGRKILWLSLDNEGAPALLEKALQSRGSRICGSVEVAAAEK